MSLLIKGFYLAISLIPIDYLFLQTCFVWFIILVVSLALVYWIFSGALTKKSPALHIHIFFNFIFLVLIGLLHLLFSEVSVHLFTHFLMVLFCVCVLSLLSSVCVVVVSSLFDACCLTISSQSVCLLGWRFPLQCRSLLVWYCSIGLFLSLYPLLLGLSLLLIFIF